MQMFSFKVIGLRSRQITMSAIFNDLVIDNYYPLYSIISSELFVFFLSY